MSLEVPVSDMSQLGPVVLRVWTQQETFLEHDLSKETPSMTHRWIQVEVGLEHKAYGTFRGVGHDLRSAVWSATSELSGFVQKYHPTEVRYLADLNTLMEQLACPTTAGVSSDTPLPPNAF